MTREDAIKEIQDASDYEVRHGDIEHHHEEIMRRVEAFEKAVNALQKYKEWIPVSERLPEEDVKVIICSLNGGIDVAYHTIKEWTEDQWEWVALRTLGYSKTYRDNKVVAWMPLPEPYGEGECKNE